MKITNIRRDKLESNAKIFDTEKRIKLLCKEQEKDTKSLTAILDRSETMVNKYVNGHNAYSIEQAKKIAKYLECDYKYLTYETDWKNFDDMKKTVTNEFELQDKALVDFIESHGYEFGNVVCYEENGNYYLEENFPEELDGFANDIIEITTPINKTYYINRDRLDSLINDFFLLFESRLMSDVMIADNGTMLSDIKASKKQ